MYKNITNISFVFLFVRNIVKDIRQIRQMPVDEKSVEEDTLESAKYVFKLDLL